MLVNPGFISDSSRRLLSRPDYAGTHIWVRKVYRADDQASLFPRIRIFGATDDEETLWTVLHNIRGEASVTISQGPGDPFGSYTIPELPSNIRATIPDPTAHVFDGRGFSYFLIGVEVPYTVLGGGDADDAYLQARIV